MELTGKNCTNGTGNKVEEKKSNVSKSGVPKKLPKRTGSISRPDVSNNIVSQSNNFNNGLELNSQGIQQIPNRSNSQVRDRENNNRPSVFKANARDILNIMDDVRSIDQQISQRVRVKKSSVTQRSQNSNSGNNVTPNLSINNTALSTNRTSRSRASNSSGINESINVESRSNLNNSVSSTSYVSNTPNRSEPSVVQ